jgi:hypothetical protein
MTRVRIAADGSTRRVAVVVVVVEAEVVGRVHCENVLSRPTRKQRRG